MGQPIFRLAHSFYLTLIDFVFPPLCLVCHNRLDPSMRFVCDSCWTAFIPQLEPIIASERMTILQNSEKYFSQSFALYEFTPAIQDLIHAMKYKEMPGLASRFGRELGDVMVGYYQPDDFDAIVPVPLHSLRLRERGYNQALLIAREIGKVMKKPVFEKGMKRCRYTNQQAKLNQEERRRNVSGAFKVRKKNAVEGKKIVLVDDVLTTGSTMNECARVLKEAGAKEIAIVTIVRV